MELKAQSLPTIRRSQLDVAVLQIVPHDPVPEFGSCEIADRCLIAKISGVNIVEITMILPTLVHDLVFEYAS